MKVFLAHGILGPFDELIYFGAEILFALTIGIRWLRSHRAQVPNSADTQDEPAESATQQDGDGKG
jgi:hypothetical protein